MQKPSFNQVFATLARHRGFSAIKYSLPLDNKEIELLKLNPNKIELLRKVKSPVALEVLLLCT